MSAVALASAAALAQMGMRHGGMMGMQSPRHQYFMRHGVDPAYAAKSNPLRATADNVAAGKRAFETNCAACHGPSGHGDGPAAKALNPPPADLTSVIHMPMASDRYLYWTIAEGGVPLGTAMPAFKTVLKEDDIWRVILYLRGL